LNLDNPSGDIKQLFAGRVEPKRIVEFLSIRFGKTIVPEKTLIIFDEIQETERALTALKYFCEDAPEYYVAASGSLLGIAMHPGTSFPVGKVEHLRLEPMDFEEFLWALGKQEKTAYVREHALDAQITFNDEFRDDFYQYLVIGGMPEVVKMWVEKRDFEAAERVLENILHDYQADFSKHLDNTTAERVNFVWQSIPSQFAKKNHKFLYGTVRSGARARDYELAIQWLVDAGLVRKVNLVNVGNKIPLPAYQDFRVFKLYLLDVGLLRALSKLAPAAVIGNDGLFKQFGGVFIEQYILQQIQFGKRRDAIFYWTGVIKNREDKVVCKAESEVDFVTSMGANVLPIEVKSGENVKAKSLKVFRDNYAPALAVRFSLLAQKYDAGLLNIPLYRAWLFDELCERYLRGESKT
jgi:predicted AAA+ superfamily ATPase